MSDAPPIQQRSSPAPTDMQILGLWDRLAVDAALELRAQLAAVGMPLDRNVVLHTYLSPRGIAATTVGPA